MQIVAFAKGIARAQYADASTTADHRVSAHSYCSEIARKVPINCI